MSFCIIPAHLSRLRDTADSSAKTPLTSPKLALTQPPLRNPAFGSQGLATLTDTLTVTCDDNGTFRQFGGTKRRCAHSWMESKSWQAGITAPSQVCSPWGHGLCSQGLSDKVSSKDALCRRCLGSQADCVRQWCNPGHSGPSHTDSSPPEAPVCCRIRFFAVWRSPLRGLGAQLRIHVCCEGNDCSRLHACCLAENESQNWISSRQGWSQCRLLFAVFFQDLDEILLLPEAGQEHICLLLLAFLGGGGQGACLTCKVASKDCFKHF